MTRRSPFYVHLPLRLSPGKLSPPPTVFWRKDYNSGFVKFYKICTFYRRLKKNLKNIGVNHYDGGHFALEQDTDENAAKIKSFSGKNVKR